MKLTRTYAIFVGAAAIIIAVALNLFIWNEIRTFLLQEIEGNLESAPGKGSRFRVLIPWRYDIKPLILIY